jgi:signal transduction histidine kinase
MMYAGLTGVTLFLLFAVILWSTARFMRHQIDDSVSNELNEVLTDAQANTPDGMRLLVQGMARHSSGFYYLLQNEHHDVLAGNLSSLDPKVGVREWSGLAKHREGTYSGIRGRGIETTGNYLFVGWSTHQLHEMEKFVAASFLWGLAASIALALTGGFMMSRRLMRKIETIGDISGNIVKGDFKQRVPIDHSGDEFDHLARSINLMLERIETLMDDLRQVTTDIAHDLRTPLTRLQNRLEFAVRTQADERSLRAVLDAARRETDIILNIFSALLRIAQVESGARRAAFASVSLSEVIENVLEIYRPAAEERHQALAESVDGDLFIVGDKELLTQLFANLVENAIRHSPPSALIGVEAHRNDRQIEVNVLDDGPGIPEGLREKVLRRLFRLESSRTTPGSGLGLSLASAIAHLHDTSIQFSDNAPGLRVGIVFKADARTSVRPSSGVPVLLKS